MDNVFQAIQETVYEDAHAHYPLPAFLETTVDLFGKAHLYYRTIKSYHLFRRAESEGRGHPAIYGAALHLAGDYTTIGSYALKVALVAKCAEDLLHQYQSLHHSYVRFQQTLYRRFPTYHSIKWSPPDPKQTAYLSPSFQFWFRSEVIGFMQQLLRVSRCALEVLAEAFKLSMCLRDTYLLTNGDPQAKYEACTELVGDWERYLNQLQADQALLGEEIAKRRHLTDGILAKLETNQTAAFILSSLEAIAVKTTEVIANDFGPLQQAGAKTLDAILPNGKVASFHFGLGEGQQFLPALPPGRYPPWAGQTVQIPKENNPVDQQAPLANPLVDLIEQVVPIQDFLWIAVQTQQLFQNMQKQIPFNGLEMDYAKSLINS